MSDSWPVFAKREKHINETQEVKEQHKEDYAGRRQSSGRFWWTDEERYSVAVNFPLSCDITTGRRRA